MLHRIFGLAVLLCAAMAALDITFPPAIFQDPVNAASYMAPEWPNAGIAPGSMFVVMGRSLGPTPLVLADSLPLKTELGGTSVVITVGGQTMRAFLVYAEYGQIAAVLPSNTPLGNGSLTVNYGGQAIGPRPIRVVRSSFGIFTRNEGGTGPGIVQNVNSEADLPVNGLYLAAQPNQAVILWGTGLGPVAGAEESRPLPGDLDVPLDVFVGGKPAKVLYKGRSGCCVGIDQINFEVPPGVEGCYVPVAVRVNGVVSNFVTMSIASQGRVCPDLPGMTAAEVAKLERGEAVNLARIEVMRLNQTVTNPGIIADATMDAGFGTFKRYRPFELLRATNVNSYWRAGAPSPGACLVLPWTGYQGLPLPAYEDPYSTGGGSSSLLQAGSALNLSGAPGSKRMSRANQAYWGFFGGLYPGEGLSPLYLEPGTYTIDNGDGGKDVGVFKATLTLPDALDWLNENSLSGISRTDDLTVTWSSPNPAKELVTVIVVSQLPMETGTVLLCTERAAAGQMTIPAWTLSALSPSGTFEGVPTAFLGVMNSPVDSESRFSAPGIDVGVLQYVQVKIKYLKVR